MNNKLKKLSMMMSTMIIVSLILSGCGRAASSASQKSTAADAAASQTGEAVSGSAGVPEYTLKLGHDATTTSVFHKDALKFKEELEKQSNGRIKVEVYPAQQLGSAREMIEGMQMGSVEATLLPTAKFGGFDQRMNIFDMPFLFSSEDSLYELMNGELGDKAISNLDKTGIKGCAFYGNGYKAITNNKKEIHLPGDLAGMKIRTMEAPLIMAQYKAWGANPVPIDFTEVYTSLQQKVVDGQENPYLTIAEMKFYEVQKYMTISNHAYLAYFLSFSKSFMDSLPEDLNKIVMEVGKDIVNYHRTEMTAANENYLKTIKDSGVQVYTLTEGERKAFFEASRPIYEEYRNIIGADLLDRALELSK